MDRAQYLAGLGALDGGSQATLESLPYNPWNFYAYPRIRWNVAQTSDQLEGEFFKGYFAEAANPMLAYYKTLEAYQLGNNVDMHYRGYCYGITPGSFPIGILAIMKTNLVAAERMATNWRTVNRIAKIRQGFDWVVKSSGLDGVDLSDLTSYLPVPAAGSMVVDLKTMTGTGSSEWQKTNWVFWAPGTLKLKVLISVSGNYQVTVSAKGKQTDGIWPTMNVFLGAGSGSVSVASTTYANYTFPVSIPATAGYLEIAFNNGASGGTRNLYLNSIQISR